MGGMITIVETKDAGLLALLNEEVQTLHHNMHPAIFKPFDKDAIEEAFNKRLSDAACKAYIAWKDGTPIGYAIFLLKDPDENPFKYKCRSLYIDQVGVLEGYRRTGVGKMLLSKAEELARELSISTVELDHWNTNSAAGSFFERNGYTTFKKYLNKDIN